MLSVAGLVLSLTGRVAYRKEATLAVVPAATRASGSNAYQLDVVSRGIIVPTLATLLDSSVTTAELERSSGASAADASVTVDPSDSGRRPACPVTAPSRASADALGTAAVALAKQPRSTTLDTGYQLSGEMAASRRCRRSGVGLPFPYC